MTLISDKPLELLSAELLTFLRTTLNSPAVTFARPLTQVSGGNEAYVYRFQLAQAPDHLSQPLLLRLFRPERPSADALKESLVQNALAKQGYPTPTVHLTHTDKADLGGTFLIMDFMAGSNMLDSAGADLPELLGQTHAALHGINTESLQRDLHHQGLPEHRFRLDGRLHWLYSKQNSYPWLIECLQWLKNNRPLEPQMLSICHGDFHPLNILVADNKVTAVIDWPGFLLGDPMLDVASTTVLIEIAAGALIPEAVITDLLNRYLATYQTLRAIDKDRLAYYQVLRCVSALIEGADGQESWRVPAVQAGLIQKIEKLTTITVTPPHQSNASM